MREDLHALEVESPEFTAVRCGMTQNTYILPIMRERTIGLASFANARAVMAEDACLQRRWG